LPPHSCLQTVKPYQQLTFSGAGNRNYAEVSALFQRYSAFSLMRTNLGLAYKQMVFERDTWLTATDGSIFLSECVHHVAVA
jgi:hypothetical protein